MNSRLGAYDDKQLSEFAASWHRERYQDTVSSTKIKRAKERYEKSLQQKNIKLVSIVKPGRPVQDTDKQVTSTTSSGSSASESSVARKPFTLSTTET